MKTAIIYSTNHGTTEKVANLIQRELEIQSVTLYNLKLSKKIDLSQFDQVIIGGSIHAGAIQGRVKEFCKKNMVTLLQKRVALFLCGMNEPEFENEFSNAFPELLRKHALSCKVVGGEFVFEKMNFIERLIVKKVSGINQSISKIDSEKVKDLVADLQKVRTETSMLFFFV
jgi:menaquinone-dependent protoporphyrinogen oxidase